MGRATCVIEGRIGKDPEPKFTKNGDTYTKFGVAVTERVKNGDQWEDGETSWYNVTCWKTLAETVSDTINKGDLILVSGRLKMETWSGDDGVERTAPAIAADSVGLVRKKNSGNESPF